MGGGYLGILGSKCEKKNHFSPWEGGTSGFGVQNVAFGVMVPDCGRFDPRTGPPAGCCKKKSADSCRLL